MFVGIARCGFVRVKVGDAIKAGDQLGEVSNSGSSLQPHLHFQVMTNDNTFPLFKNLVPFKICQVRMQIGREWKAISNAEPSNGDHLRL